MIDLRSDTVTHPTSAMRRAMAEAVVGDDVYGDDPTVNRLQAEAAQLTGHEDALLVVSGTMGNQLALMAHTDRGDEVILDEQCHIIGHEVGAPAVLSGVNLRALPSRRGCMSPEDVRRAFRDPDDIHVPRSRLFCLENAHSTGTVPPLSYMREMSALARELGLAVHLDGARLFNAAAVLKRDPSELAQCADSVMFCLSKGLCAPVGSMLCGNRAFIAKARKYRKLLGGGMRQAGILAAAGLLAISPEMRGRLEEDHENARRLYSGLSGLFSSMRAPDINMVYFSLADSGISPESLINAFAAADILFNPPSASGEVRLVTHHGVSAADINKVIEVIRSAAP